MNFICPKCKTALTEEEGWIICEKNHRFAVRDGIYDFLPENMNLITEADAAYHASIKDEWIDLNQIVTLRNIYYHLQIVDFVKNKSNSETNILEIGGGVGFDLGLLINRNPLFNNYIFSEISHEMTSYVKGIINDDKVIYCNIDARYLPFSKNSLDIAYMIATLHHFPEIESTFYEIVQIVKPGGYIVCGIEPNKKLIHVCNLLKKPLKRLLGFHKDSSLADEKAEGFDTNDFISLAMRHNLRIDHIEPVFFFCGFFHQILELVYRLWRLKKRLRLPLFFERILIKADLTLFRFSFFRKISWHYSVFFQKNV